MLWNWVIGYSQGKKFNFSKVPGLLKAGHAVILVHREKEKLFRDDRHPLRHPHLQELGIKSLGFHRLLGGRGVS